jgi:hypothetical protein
VDSGQSGGVIFSPSFILSNVCPQLTYCSRNDARLVEESKDLATNLLAVSLLVV